MGKLTCSSIKIGMKIRSIYNGGNSMYAARLDKTGTILTLETRNSHHCSVDVDWDDGNSWCKSWGGDVSEYFEEFDGKPRKPRKVIPDIPLDPTLPILMAGHLQDRARKKF